jgi:hypothetical protein
VNVYNKDCCVDDEKRRRMSELSTKQLSLSLNRKSPAQAINEDI